MLSNRCIVPFRFAQSPIPDSVRRAERKVTGSHLIEPVTFSVIMQDTKGRTLTKPGRDG